MEKIQKPANEPEHTSPSQSWNGISPFQDERCSGTCVEKEEQPGSGPVAHPELQTADGSGSGRHGSPFRSRKLWGAFCIAAGSALYGILGLFTRQLNAVGLDSMKIVCVRMIGSALVLAVFSLIMDRSAFRIRLRDLWMFFGTGILSHILYNWCYFHCIRISSLSVSAAFLYTAPTFSMLLSVLLFRERFTRRKGLVLAMTVLGCFLVAGIAGGAEDISTSVVICGLGAALGHALYGIFSRFALRRYNPHQIILWTNICGGAFSLVLVNQIGLVRQLTHYRVYSTVLVLIVVSTILPMLLVTIGHRYLEPGIAGIVGAVEPVVAALISRFVYKEEMTWTQLAGAVIVVAAVAILARQIRDEDERRPPKSGAGRRLKNPHATGLRAASGRE